MSRLVIDRLRQQQQQQPNRPPQQHRVLRRRSHTASSASTVPPPPPPRLTLVTPPLRDDSLTSGIVSDESCSVVATAAAAPAHSRGASAGSGGVGGPSVHFGDTFVHLIPSRSDLSENDENNSWSIRDDDDGVVVFEEEEDRGAQFRPPFVDIDIDAVGDESEVAGAEAIATDTVAQRVANSVEANRRFYRLCYNLDSGSGSGSSIRGAGATSAVTESQMGAESSLAEASNPSGKCISWLRQQQQPPPPPEAQQPQIPDRFLLLAFSYLDSPQLCRCAAVCRSWYRLAWHPALWTGLELHDPGLDANAAIDSVTKILSYASYPHCLGLLRVSVANSVTLTDRALSLLGSRCPRLQRATFRACPRLTGLGARELLHGCQRLRHLRLVSCHGISMALPVTAPRLIDLEVVDCRSFDDASLRALGDGMCPRLNRLYLRRCPAVTDNGLAALGSGGGCPGLRDICLKDFDTEISELGLERLLRRCGRRLRCLSFIRCELVNDPVLFHIAVRAPNLQRLSLRNCRRVTDLGVERLARGLGPAGPPLELDFGGCDVTDDAVAALASSGGCLARLTRLCLRGCDCVTDQGLNSLVSNGCPNLVYLNLLGCSVSPHAVQNARTALPPSAILHFSLA